MSVSELGDCGLFEVTSSKCRWWVQSRDGRTCPVSPCLAQIWASGTCSQHSWHLCLWFLWIQHSWASIPGVRTPLACTCHIRVPQTHIPCILVPLVHNHVLFYSSPTIIEFWVLLVVVEVRGGWVVIIVIIKVIRLMGQPLSSSWSDCWAQPLLSWFIDFCSCKYNILGLGFEVWSSGSSLAATWTWTS